MRWSIATLLFFGVSFPLYVILPFYNLYQAKVRGQQGKLLVATCFLLLSTLIILANVYYSEMFPDLVDLIKYIRYWFGAFIFYFAFVFANRNHSLSKRLDQMFSVHFWLNLLCIQVIFEAFVINTFLPADILPNNPLPEAENFRTQYFGFYQRPFGIAGNPSINSMFIVFLLASLSKPRLAQYASASIAVLAQFAASGWLMLILYFFLKAKILVTLTLCFLIFASYFLYLNDFFTQYYHKLSTEGFEMFLEYKYDDLVRKDIKLSFFSADITQGGFADDSGWLPALNSIGILGTLTHLGLLLLLFIALNKLRLAIILMFISGFHYSLVFHPFGHLWIAYFASKMKMKRLTHFE